MANTTIIVPNVSLRLVSVRGLWLEGGTPTLALTTGDLLNISGWDDGWPTGFLANVDEAIAVADGSTVSTTFASDPVIFDLSASVLTNADTVTGITLTLRAELVATGTGGFDVELLIGGVSQGTESLAISGGMSNYVLTNAGWDQDWTAAQLSGMQVRITTRQDTSEVTSWAIDCMDVEIAFLPGILFAPPEIRDPAPTLTGYAPVPDPSTNFKQARPPAADDVVLAGKTPTTDTGIAVGSTQLTLAGKPSYPNPVTTQLQLSGWDNGWPTGFVSNVDEPVAVADGSTVSTTISQDVALFDFDDVTGTIVDSDTVLGISMTVRARNDYDSGIHGSPAAVFVSLRLDGATIGGNWGIYIIGLTTSMTNWELATIAPWEQDWTVAELNRMQVRVQAATDDDGQSVFLDTIDILVKHTPQSPKKLIPGVGALALSPKLPTLEDLRVEKPLVGAVTLAGKVPTLKRDDNALPSADRLFTNGKGVARVVNFLAKPAIGTLVTAGKVPAPTVGHLVLPAVKTLALAGKIPVADVTRNHARTPSTKGLVLFPHRPLRITADDTPIGPSRGRGDIAGYAPGLGRTDFVLREPAAVALTIATAAPSTISPVLIPAVVALSLTTLTPLRVPSTVITMAALPLALSGHLPALGPLAAELALTTYVPVATVNHLAQPAAAAVTVAGQRPNFDNASSSPTVGTLNFTGYAPSLSFSAGLTSGSPGIISLTVDREIEFIATPTDILIG